MVTATAYAIPSSPSSLESPTPLLSGDFSKCLKTIYSHIFTGEFKSKEKRGTCSVVFCVKLGTRIMNKIKDVNKTRENTAPTTNPAHSFSTCTKSTNTESLDREENLFIKGCGREKPQIGSH